MADPTPDGWQTADPDDPHRIELADGRVVEVLAFTTAVPGFLDGVHGLDLDGARSTMPSPTPWLRQRLTLGIVLWSLVTGFLRLGAAPVYLNNEAREGVYARAMLDSGDWVLPDVPNHVENGEIVPDKPPLFHWISIAVAWLRTVVTMRSIPSGLEVSRRFDEWALRFPSVVCGLLMVMSVTLGGRRILGDRAALLAAASLLVCVQYVRQLQYGRVDMVMAAFVTLAMVWLAQALLDGSSRALVGAAAASGLAVLAKGPIGLALPALVGALWIGIESLRGRSMRHVLDLPWRLAAATWATIVVPWYVGALAHGGMAFVRSQLLTENLWQYTGANDWMPRSYYIRPWLYMSFPWNLLGLIGVGLAWRRRDRRALFCAVWWLGFLIFFQLSAYKRASYLLPALPAGAMMCGYFLAETLPSNGRAWLADLEMSRSGCGITALLIGIVATSLGAWIVSVPGVWPFGISLTALDGARCGLDIAIALVALALLVRSFRARRWGAAFISFWAFEAAVFHGIVTTGAIAIARRGSPKPLVARLVADLPKGEAVTLLGVGDDSTLPILLYFPDPTRIVVVPARNGLPASFAPGYYLLGAKTWTKLTRPRNHPSARWRALLAGERWRILWTGEFGDPKRPTRVVSVQRTGAGEALPFRPKDGTAALLGGPTCAPSGPSADGA